MSKAGKFIPGGASRKSTIQGPIRSPEAEPRPSTAKKLLDRSANLTRKPVPKKNRLPILIMSSVVCCLLVSIAWYRLGVLPARRALIEEKRKEAAMQVQLAAVSQQQQSSHPGTAVTATAVVSVDSTPAGTATIGTASLPTPATFKDVPAGKITLTIHADGYTDYRQDLEVSADKPTDLGKISLTRALGNVVLTSAQKNVTYTLTGPDNYTHDGAVPDKLESLPTGNYQLVARQPDWQLPPFTITVSGRQDLKQDIVFPYGSAHITSVPPGATIRRKNVILGRTPLEVPSLRPGSVALTIDLPPYTIQRFTLVVPSGDKVTREIKLDQGKDFIAACGIPMVWIPDGYWVEKYEVDQGTYESIMKVNPSGFRSPTHPVENVSWEDATAFCEKLNLSEAKAGKLPKGFHYTLPTEAQWDIFSADADIDLAVTSRTDSRSSTQPVGSSEPNKFGLYDTIGNVWEWCQDAADENGAHSLRGGSWLSSNANFPNAQTHSAGAAKYADRFTGFRVVLVAQ